MPKPQLGRFSETREAWTTLQRYEVVCFVGDHPDFEAGANGGEAVKLVFRVPGRRQPWILSLTGMTLNELDELKKCIDFAFDKARPEVIRLDEAAIEAFNNGDDSWSRLYRPDVQFIQRGKNHGPYADKRVSVANGDGRVQPEHSEGVPSGPDGSEGVVPGEHSEHLPGPFDGDSAGGASPAVEAADGEGSGGGPAGGFT